MSRHLCLAIAALSIIAPGARADATSEARKQIQAAYNRENAAAARKDASGVLANLTPDYESTNFRGETANAEVVRKRLPMLFAITMSLKAKTTITQIAVNGGQADVRTKEHAELIMMNPQTRKPSKLVVDETAQTLWIKTAGTWKKKRSKTLSARQTLDGKIIRPPKRGQPQ